MGSEYMLGPELGAIIVDKYVGGTDEHGCYNGKGEALFRNGNTYNGDFCRGVMHGRGRYVWISDGAIYEGDFSKNELMGTGRYTWSDGSSYDGGVSQGLRSGRGTFTNSDGTLVYQGSWKASKRHGHGVQRYGVGTAAVSSYDGEWNQNRRHGRGTMTYASGNTYEGGWIEDRKEGKGVMLWVHRRERYSGDWNADLQCGNGEHVWLEDRPQASAAMDTQKQMCNVYRGQWFDGMRHGQGTFKYANGSRHTGGWFKNKKHGPAVFIADDGRAFEGAFKNDAMVGQMDQDEDHPELRSAIRLKITDLLLSSEDEPTRAKAVRDVERSVLQINSELKAIYKHYAKPGSTAPGDSTMFTMSIYQFVVFAKDCHALAPATLVTVGEVYRMFHRMRRQHDWEIASGLRGAMQAGGVKEDVTCAPSFEGPAETEDVYDSRRAITFREFVEGTVRLSSIIDALTGSACTGNTTVAVSASPATTTLNQTISNSPQSPTNHRVTTASTEIAGPLLAAGDDPGGRHVLEMHPKPTQEPSINAHFKRFVKDHLSGLLAGLAVADSSGHGGSSSGGSRGSGGRSGGKVGDRGGGKGGSGGGERGKGATGVKQLPSAGVNRGAPEDDGKESSCVKEIREADEQMKALHRLYRDPPHMSITLRSVLRISRDAKLKQRADLTSDDVKKVFREVCSIHHVVHGCHPTEDHSSLSSSSNLLAAESPEGESVGGAERNSSELSATAGSTAVGAAAPSLTIDLDLLDQEVLPEEFASVLAGMFEILRERAVSRHASEVADALDETVNEPVEEGVAPDQVQPTPDDNDDGDDRMSAPPQGVSCARSHRSSQGISQGNVDANITTVPPSVGSEHAPPTTTNKRERGASVSVTSENGQKAPAVPTWLRDPVTFISQILEWAKRSHIKRHKSSLMARPAERTLSR